MRIHCLRSAIGGGFDTWFVQSEPGSAGLVDEK